MVWYSAAKPVWAGSKITGEENSGGLLQCSVKSKAPEPRAFHILCTHNCVRRILFRLQRQALQTEENARIKVAVLIWHLCGYELQSTDFKTVCYLSTQDPCMLLYARWVTFPNWAVIQYFVFPLSLMCSLKLCVVPAFTGCCGENFLSQDAVRSTLQGTISVHCEFCWFSSCSSEMRGQKLLYVNPLYRQRNEVQQD